MERYTALAAMIRECCSGVRAETLRRRAAAGEKIVYYFSMEFLVGRLLENYLIQLGIRDMTADILAEFGEDLDALLECERDPGLGNGGLGRLAACYLDSLAAEDVPCVGMGLRYRYGLFRQRIRSGCQTEEPDDWLSDGYPWETAVPWRSASAAPWTGARRTAAWCMSCAITAAFSPRLTTCPSSATARTR